MSSHLVSLFIFLTWPTFHRLAHRDYNRLVLVQTMNAEIEWKPKSKSSRTPSQKEKAGILLYIFKEFNIALTDTLVCKMYCRNKANAEINSYWSRSSVKSHSFSWDCVSQCVFLPSCPHLPLPYSQVARSQAWQTAGRETSHHLEYHSLPETTEASSPTKVTFTYYCVWTSMRLLKVKLFLYYFIHTEEVILKSIWCKIKC